MLTIAPFRALLPPAEKAHLVASVPYDVVSRDEAAAMAGENPLSFLRVSRPEIEFPAEADPYGDEIYARAAENFEKLKSLAPLNDDKLSHFYAYSLFKDGHRQSGLVAACSVDDYDDDRIKKHEKTRQDKEDDRARHTLEIRAHSGPVFLVCRSSWNMDSTIQEVMGNSKPLFDVTDEKGVQHQIWRIPEAYHALLEHTFSQMKKMYIADGHHRAKSASRTREACRKANPNHTGDEAYNRFLGVIFPDNQVKVLPYNRAVKDLNGLTQEALLAKVGDVFTIAESAEAAPSAPQHIHMYIGGQWYDLVPKQVPETDSPAEKLDVSILQNQLLSPILGIDDPRTNKRIDFIGGIRGTAYLEQLVDSGKAAVTFSMYPVTCDDLMAIADRDEIMPPKSTWFEPKLMDGFLIHTF